MFKKLLFSLAIVALFVAAGACAPVTSVFEYGCSTTTFYAVNVSSFANTTIAGNNARSALVLTADDDNTGVVDFSNDPNNIVGIDNGLAAGDQAVDLYYDGTYYLRAQAGQGLQRIIVQDIWRN